MCLLGCRHREEHVYKWFVFCILLFGRAAAEETILVSIPPYQAIVQSLVGKSAAVHSVVPQGTHLHSFEPSPATVETIHRAALWFVIGDPFEQKILSAIPQKSMRVVDLRQGLDLVSSHACPRSGMDTHIWLSPRLMLRQLQTITDALQEMVPEQKKQIAQRSSEYRLALETLIAKADELLQGYSGKSIVVAHAAYGYLCRDYGLVQLSVEQEGKEPTIYQLNMLLEAAKKHGVHTVFSLHQYPRRGIERIAELLNAKVVELDPYALHYLDSMLHTIESFHMALVEEQGEKQ